MGVFNKKAAMLRHKMFRLPENIFRKIMQRGIVQKKLVSI